MPEAQKRFVVAIASVMHESNSFNPVLTQFTDFRFQETEPRLKYWGAGKTEVAGMIAGATAEELELVPVVFASATPSGPVEPAAFEALCDRLLDGLRSLETMDGVLLALHGAMFCPAFPHADAEIVRRVRQLIGFEIPLVLTLDFHANIPPSLIELTDALLTYQQCPHTDTFERGQKAALLMADILQKGVKPSQFLVKPPMMLNIVFHGTKVAPLQEITDASIALEKELGILAASVAGGYQYGDVEFMGPSVIVVTDGSRNAKQEAQQLSDLLWNRRDAMKLSLPSISEAVAHARNAEKGPVSLFDIGDNIGGGSPGDETSLLAELIDQKAIGWVYVLFDPTAVEAAKAAGIGGSFSQAVGGHTDGVRSDPVQIFGTVRNLNLGQFIEPQIRHGGHRYWDMGHAAVIEVEGSTPDDLSLLVLTSKPCPPFSVNQLTSCGIDPSQQKIIVVKGVVAPRAAYDPISAEVVLVDTPGLTAVNPVHFHFERANQNLWGMKPE